MKFCTKCGNELMDEAVICPKCGCATGYQGIQSTPSAPAPAKTTNDFKNLAKIFMIIGTVIAAFGFFPLFWCVPMTIAYCNKVDKGEPVGVGFKVCCLLFVSLLGGIFMLCDQD